MAPPSSQLQIDEWILDYLLWYCTDVLLNSPSSHKADTTIRLVNSFYTTFHRLHPHTTLPEPLAFRLTICRFTCAFLRRIDVTSPDFSVPSSHNRTLSWLRRRRQTSVLPTPQAAHFSTPLPHVPRSPPDHIQGTLTLRDALWEFMLMSTHTAARFEEVSEVWMDMAVGFMEQAALEAYRELDAEGVGALGEAFAYGITPADYDESTSIGEIVVNDMFGGNDGEVGRDFEELRRETLEGLVPPQGVGLGEHLESVAAENPLESFETNMRVYIQAIASSQLEPALAQLEKGGLEGYDTREVQEMLARAGVAV